MRVMRVVSFAMAVACLPSALYAQASAVHPPRSAEELAERYRRAHAAKDVESIKQLFYWGASSDRTRRIVSSFVAQDVMHAVRSVTIVALDSSDVTHYTQDGVEYRMTIPPVAKLRIDFLPRDANGGHYNSEQTSYFIGRRNGEYWLVTAEPAPSELFHFWH